MNEYQNHVGGQVEPAKITPIDRLTAAVKSAQTAREEMRSLAGDLVGYQPEAGDCADAKAPEDPSLARRMEVAAEAISEAARGISREVERIRSRL